VVQLHRSKDRFAESGFQIILVGLGNPEQSEKFRKDFSPDFSIICDPQKNLFKAYGLGRGSLSDMASPGIFFKGLRTLTRGHTPGLPRGDIFQLPGVFMIDTLGNIRYSHYAKNPSDYPSVESLLSLRNVLMHDN
jgi:hypothetical protein